MCRPDIAERVLGHAIGGVEGIYDRHRYDAEKADALKQLAALIDEIVNGTPAQGDAAEAEGARQCVILPSTRLLLRPSKKRGSCWACPRVLGHCALAGRRSRLRHTVQSACAIDACMGVWSATVG